MKLLQELEEPRYLPHPNSLLRQTGQLVDMHHLHSFATTTLPHKINWDKKRKLSVVDVVYDAVLGIRRSEEYKKRNTVAPSKIRDSFK